MSNMFPLQYIESVNPNTNNTHQQSNSDTGYNVSVAGNNSSGTAKVVWASSGGSVEKQDVVSSAPATTAIYTNLSAGGQTATLIPASALQQNRDHGTVHLQPHAQILHHGGNAYLVQSATRFEDDSPNLSHTTKASPVTLQWLIENYETAEGVSLPRSTLYNHYLQHCQQEKLEPMNQASFGKLIRSVFNGLRTRRLGTRGNSKYHYYGIRIKPNSPLNHYVEDQTFAMRQYPSFNRQNEYHWRSKYNNNGVNYGVTGSAGLGSGNIGGSSQGTGFGAINNSSGVGAAGAGLETNTANPGLVPNSGSGGGGGNQHSNYLGESTSALPNLGDIVARAELDSLTDDECQAHNVSMDEINVFCQMYLEHSDTVLGSVVYLNFKFIENHWQDFWRTSVKPQNSQWEDKLPKLQLLRLLKLPQVQKFLQLFDNVFYQSLVEVLIPNVLRPIPSALTQSIRHFAKSLEGWMASATASLPSPVVSVKMSCVCALAQTLRRHTSLNHLAQAARAVLKNASQIGQMLTDLNRVDFANVQEQASWVCAGCDSQRVDALQHDFKRILQQQASLEDWALWLDKVVTDYLQPYRNSARYPDAAHNFILRWSFYSSMVIRDLTLRSAASFGSFHLIRLLYDEYIYYLVEQKVAEHLDLTPVAVTGDMGRQLMARDCSNASSSDNLDQLHSEMLDEDRKERLIDMRKSLDEDDDDEDEEEDDEDDDGACGERKDEREVAEAPVTETEVSPAGDETPAVSCAEEVGSTATVSGTASAVPAATANSTSTASSRGGVGTTKMEPQRPTSIIGGSGVRKTVNVTTFGDPPPLCTPLATAPVGSASGTPVKPAMHIKPDLVQQPATKRIKLVNTFTTS